MTVRVGKVIVEILKHEHLMRPHYNKKKKKKNKKKEKTANI